MLIAGMANFIFLKKDKILFKAGNNLYPAAKKTERFNKKISTLLKKIKFNTVVTKINKIAKYSINNLGKTLRTFEERLFCN